MAPALDDIHPDPDDPISAHMRSMAFAVSAHLKVTEDLIRLADDLSTSQLDFMTQQLMIMRDAVAKMQEAMSAEIRASLE